MCLWAIFFDSLTGTKRRTFPNSPVRKDDDTSDPAISLSTRYFRQADELRPGAQEEQHG